MVYSLRDKQNVCRKEAVRYFTGRIFIARSDLIRFYVFLETSGAIGLARR